MEKVWLFRSFYNPSLTRVFKDKEVAMDYLEAMFISSMRENDCWTDDEIYEEISKMKLNATLDEFEIKDFGWCTQLELY